MSYYAQIIIQFATVSEIDKPFTYKVPEPLIDQIAIGKRVKVPFGRGSKLQIGYVLALNDTFENQGFRIKAIAEVIDKEPLLSDSQMELVAFIVRHYGTSYAAAIDAVLPPGVKDEPLARERDTETVLRLKDEGARLTSYLLEHSHKKTFAKQKWLIEYVRGRGVVTLKEVEAEPLFSKSSLYTLLKNEYIIKEERKTTVVKPPIYYERFRVLNEEQDFAVNRIKVLIEKKASQTVLLQGVTGSGKTEVFLHVIKGVVESGGTALVLVPEIALTKQIQTRFEERFGNRVALTHSRMSVKERQRLYMKAREGQISIIIGPRSAIFMPLPDLQLIVIDEAHESSYKSDMPPKYHAIDIARKRLEKGGVVLLATATPSVESYYKAQQGEYELIELKARVGGAVMPEVDIVDMRLELASGNNSVLSRKLYMEIETALKADGQVMLLINRRGHSTFVNCRSCGFVVKCDHCDVSMTYHSSRSSLECHYCGKSVSVPEVCPECGSKYIRFFGTGTEKVEVYLKEHFGEYGVLRMDLDTTTGKEGHAKILEAFRKREFNLLIGTQMIAKGHDFPNVTLVGVLSADMSLYMEDFRSNERTFQLITQAMGRAGRGQKRGKVVVQTYSPDHMVMEVIKNNKQAFFYEQELANRKILGYPPFTYLFTILMTGKDEETVMRMMQRLTEYYRHYSKKGQTYFRVIGPAMAAIGKIGDEYRWRLLIVAEDREKLLIYGKYCLEKFYHNENTTDIKIGWEIDPQTML